MVNILKYTEYIYLIVAFFSIYRIYTEWNVEGPYRYLFIFFAVVSIGMFLFRRNYRKKFEKHQQDNKE